MGAFSEINIQQVQGDAFCEDMELPGFTDCGAENVPISADVSDAAPDTQVVPPAQDKTPAGDSGVSPDKAAEDAKAKAEDDARRQEHEAAEAKRKAEWEARRQRKKDAEQEQLARLETMSDDELLAASTKRVNDDTEKLTRRNMKDCVSEYIQTMCLDNPAFARKTLHPRKSMAKCFRYIREKAWEYIQDELKAEGIEPGRGQDMHGADVPDDLCYQWAVDYFNDPDAKVDQEEEEEFVPKPYYSQYTPSTTSSKKKEPKKKAETPKSAQKKAADASQISFGGFTMPEEEAG